MRQTTTVQPAALAALVLLAAGPGRARAQQPSDSAGGRQAPAVAGARAPARDSAATLAVELRELVVSAARPAAEQAATVRVIDGARMRALGARTLDQALALVAGVGVRTGSEGVPRVDYRGFRPRQLLVLLDGVPLNSTFDGQPDLSLIPTERIAYVKLTGGTASVLYGEALGGVIEVVTRDAVGQFHGDATLEARSGPARSARLSGGGATGALSVYAAASASGSQGFPAIPLGGGAAVREQNSARAWSTAFGSATLTGPRGRVGLVLTGGSGSYGIPPTDVTDPSDPFASRPIYQRVQRLAGASAQLSGAWLAARTLTLRAWAFGNGQDERSAQFDDSTYSAMTSPAVKGTFQEDAHTRLLGSGFQAAWSASALSRLTLALSAERDSWSVDGVIRDVPVTATGSSGGKSGGGTGSGSGSGGTTTWNTRALSDLRALGRLGAALEWQLTPVPALGFALGAAHHVLVRDSAGREGADALVAGGRWLAPAGVHVRASAARRFRFPTISQLYDVANGGNPALAPERANELDLGAERAFGRAASLTLTAFRADVRGFINRGAQAQPLTNRGPLRFQGVEGTVATRPLATLGVDASLAYLSTADRSPGANGQELQYTPRLRALLDARWHPDDATTVALSLARVVHQVYYSRQAPVQTGRLPDYTLAGARLARRLPGGRAEAYVGGDNLLDAVYQDQYGFPRPARTLYAGLSASW